MTKPALSSTVTVLWTGALAVLMTALVSGIWAGLLGANLATSPTIPWAAVAMGLVIWALWAYLGGRFPPRGTHDARRVLLRSAPLPAPVLAWAIFAGVLGVVALAGFWIVLHRLVATHGNPQPDFSRLPKATVVISLAMAAISGGVSEEAGFRGYFQGALERRGLGAFAILVAGLVMSPIHALTQGFVWPNLVFYLLVDGLLGALAYVTGSIRPGVVVHCIGLFIFFALVWPNDAHRQLISVTGTDTAFWLSLGQTVVCGVFGAAAFAQLLRATKGRAAAGGAAAALA